MARSDTKTTVWSAVFGNLLVAITKIVAAIITGSSAMLSEAFHSVVDTGSEAILLYGMRRSQRRLRRPGAVVPLRGELVAGRVERLSTVGDEGYLAAIRESKDPPQVVVALSVKFEDHLVAPEIENIVVEMEEKIRQAQPQVLVLFVKPQSPEAFAAAERRIRGRSTPRTNGR